MRFALVFMMSILVVITHQYFPDQRVREMPWLSPYLPHPIIDKYQQPFIFYYPKPRVTPEIYSSHDLSWENPQGNADLFYTENTPKSFAEFSNLEDVQSRGKLAALLPEKMSPRFFFGTSATITNPFFKTATFTVSSTLTLSSVVRCIVAGDFVAGGVAQLTPCRRKRGFLEALDKFEDEQFDTISPSKPQLLMSTTLPSLDTRQKYRQFPSDQQHIINHEILSSQEVENLLPKSMETSLGGSLKEKRFLLFNNNPYVVSKTVTTYAFVSKTSTATVDVAINVGLNCLPTGYVVC